MKIELTNNTHWQSDHIRAFIARCMKEERPDLCKRGAPAMKVRVVYTRGGTGSSGCAYLKSNAFTIRLSKENPDKIDFAKVIAHELAHTRGMTHAQMRGNSRYRRIGSHRTIYAWADNLPLEKTTPKRKLAPTPDKKLAHAEKMLKSALTREKRAVTLRKKWEAKVRYYTKRAALPPSPPKSPTLPKTTPQTTLAEWVAAFGFKLEEHGDNEYEVFTKDGFNMGASIAVCATE